MNVVYVILCFQSDQKQIDLHLKVLRSQTVLLVENTQDVSRKIRISVSNSHHHFLQMKSNAGYAGGMNRGMQWACEHHADWFVLLNDDVQLIDAFVDSIQQQLSSLKPGMYGPEVGSLDLVRYTSILDGGEQDTLHVDYISGSCLAVHRDVYTKIGGMYEPYFLYYEDVEYSLRSRRAGFQIGYIPVNGISHDGSRSTKRGSWLHEYYLFRNHCLFVVRNAPIRIVIRECLRFPKTVYEYVISVLRLVI